MGEDCVVAMYGSKQHRVGEGEGVRSLKTYKTLGKKERYLRRIWKPFLGLQGACVLSLKCHQEEL